MIFKQRPGKKILSGLANYLSNWTPRRVKTSCKSQGRDAWCFPETAEPEWWSRVSKENSGKRQEIGAPAVQDSAVYIIFAFTF